MISTRENKKIAIFFMCSVFMSKLYFSRIWQNPGTVPWTRLPRILAVPKSSHGTQIPETLRTGTKIVGIVPGF